MNETTCVLACVTAQKDCAALIRKGHALAREKDVPLRVLHVSQAKNIMGSQDSAAILNELFSLAHEADAEMNILYEENVAAAIARYAGECGASVLVLGPKKLSANWNTYKGNYRCRHRWHCPDRPLPRLAGQPPGPDQH